MERGDHRKEKQQGAHGRILVSFPVRAIRECALQIFKQETRKTGKGGSCFLAPGSIPGGKVLVHFAHLALALLTVDSRLHKAHIVRRHRLALALILFILLPGFPIWFGVGMKILKILGVNSFVDAPALTAWTWYYNVAKQLFGHRFLPTALEWIAAMEADGTISAVRKTGMSLSHPVPTGTGFAVALAFYSGVALLLFLAICWVIRRKYPELGNAIG